MRRKLKITARKPTTAHQERASTSTQIITLTTQIGEGMPRLGVPKDQDSTEPTQSASCLNVTSIGTTRFWFLEWASEASLAPIPWQRLQRQTIPWKKLQRQTTQVRDYCSRRLSSVKMTLFCLTCGSCSSNSSVRILKVIQKLGLGLI